MLALILLDSGFLKILVEQPTLYCLFIVFVFFLGMHRYDALIAISIGVSDFSSGSNSRLVFR